MRQINTEFIFSYDSSIYGLSDKKGTPMYVAIKRSFDENETSYSEVIEEVINDLEERYK